MPRVKFYCINDPKEDIILSGNIDSLIRGEAYKNFRIVIHTCNQETRLSGDPECSSDDEID